MSRPSSAAASSLRDDQDTGDGDPHDDHDLGGGGGAGPPQIQALGKLHLESSESEA